MIREKLLGVAIKETITHGTHPKIGNIQEIKMSSF